MSAYVKMPLASENDVEKYLIGEVNAMKQAMVIGVLTALFMTVLSAL